jgi:hypothetical protein
LRPPSSGGPVMLLPVKVIAVAGVVVALVLLGHVIHAYREGDDGPAQGILSGLLVALALPAIVTWIGAFREPLIFMGKHGTSLFWPSVTQGLTLVSLIAILVNSIRIYRDSRG